MQHSNVHNIELEELSIRMKDQSRNLIIIDCRSVMEYSTSHICDAINIGGTRNSRREIMNGRVPILSVLHDKIRQTYNKDDLLVVYDQCSVDNNNIQSLAGRVAEELALCFNHVWFLRGGFIGFQSKFSDLCWTNKHKMPDEDIVTPAQSMICSHSIHDSGASGSNPLLTRSQTMITLTTDDSHQNQLLPSDCDNGKESPVLQHSFLLSRHSLSGPALPLSKEGPTTVLPYLLLGTQQDALSQSCILKHGITHVINVSTDGPMCPFICPQNFIRIPVLDNFHDKITPYFPNAFQFLDNVKIIGGRVLVHCSAGISRSPTLAIGYLMKTLHISVAEAYRIVKSSRTSVSPNFNFLGQLTEYEELLRTEVNETLQYTPATVAGNTKKLVSNRLKKRPSRLGFLTTFLKHRPPTSPGHDSRLNTPSLLAASLLPSPSVPFARLGINSPMGEAAALKWDNIPTTSLDQLQFQPCQTVLRGIKTKRSATEADDDSSKIRKRLSLMESFTGDIAVVDKSRSDLTSDMDTVSCRQYISVLPVTPDPATEPIRSLLQRDNSLDRGLCRSSRSVSYERISCRESTGAGWSRSSSIVIDSCRLQECHQSTSSLSSANSHSSNLLV